MPAKPPIDRSAGRWWGQTACVIASGPSLNAADCDAVARTGWRVIAINDSWRLARYADVLYACDGAWWQAHIAQVKKEFAGELWTQDPNVFEQLGLSRIGSVNAPGLGRSEVIHQGGNSGYQAINLAWLWGAQRIFLLGFDCQPGENKKAHWFGQHEGRLSKIQNYALWKTHYPKLAEDLASEGAEVFNLSRATALTCFKQLSLEDAITNFSVTGKAH